MLYVEQLFLCSNAVDGVHIFKSLMWLPCKGNDYECDELQMPLMRGAD